MVAALSACCAVYIPCTPNYSTNTNQACSWTCDYGNLPRTTYEVRYAGSSDGGQPWDCYVNGKLQGLAKPTFPGCSGDQYDRKFDANFACGWSMETCDD